VSINGVDNEKCVEKDVHRIKKEKTTKRKIGMMYGDRKGRSAV
jgi:hypothetical protein